MLTINGRSKRVCSGTTRRDLIRAGGLGMFGLTLPKLLAAEQAQQQLVPTHGFTPGAEFPVGRAKSDLFIFLLVISKVTRVISELQKFNLFIFFY